MKKDFLKTLHPQTRAIHGGRNPDVEYGSASPPIYQTSTFKFADAKQGADRFAGTRPGYVYSRLANPTVNMLEEKLAILENGAGALATSTGMAAVSAVYFTFLEQGDRVVGTDALYGPTRMIVEQYFSRYGVTGDFIDTSDMDRVEKALAPKTKMLVIESPANPTMKLADIAACAALCKERSVLLVVDNTFMTPVLQRPLDLGADIVIHSLTKFINGHTDVIGGAIVTADEEKRKAVHAALTNLGGTMDPHQAWLVIRGGMTLDMRLRRAQANAEILAERLERHPKVKKVMYPGLPSHPQHELAKRQADGFGALLAFDLAGGVEAGERMLNALRLCVLAVSLGGVETLIQHPSSMTHHGVPRDERLKAGITDGLVRLSVGCEHVDDLWNDLAQALETV